MIDFKTLTIKNFMSIGNITQFVSFDTNSITLILGENLDVAGEGTRNGVGKSTIAQALHFVLFGMSIGNKIRLNNLINKSNDKNLVVSLDFEINQNSYRIVRGRKTNFLQFFINDGLRENEDESQGESRKTQAEIEKILGLTPQMFTQIILQSTPSVVEPYLSLTLRKQRDIIEQLLGVTLLTEKADHLKELIKENKLYINKEEFKIETIKRSNEKIFLTIKELERSQQEWSDNQTGKINRLTMTIDNLKDIDIGREFELHKASEQRSNIIHALKPIQVELTQIEKTKHDYDVRIYDINKKITRISKRLDELTIELEKSLNETCPTCGSPLTDENHNRVLTDLKIKVQSYLAEHKEHMVAKQAILDSLDEITIAANTATTDIHELNNVLTKIDQLPKPYYKTKDEVLNHQSSYDVLLKQREEEEKSIDPFISQIMTLQKTAVQKIDYVTKSTLELELKHQDFLYRLLTDRKSYIRKKIIDQNLSFLNYRLNQYLDTLGLPHQVMFMNDLSVEITDLGREFDFGNLSSGEKTRLILGLSWAFRDLWETLNQPMNLFFIDELIDSNLDSAGVEASLQILKQFNRDRNKTIMLVSHREELMNRVSNVMNVIKEGGFTRIETSSEDNNIEEELFETVAG